MTPPHGAAGTGNVLVIMADEHAARVAGFAGHSVVQTPHLDRLASEGTVFERAWTPSPICVPARGAFATGRWVHEVGTWHSAQPYTGEPGGWAHAARFAGATVVSVGKLHYRSGDDDIGLAGDWDLFLGFQNRFHGILLTDGLFFCKPLGFEYLYTGSRPSW